MRIRKPLTDADRAKRRVYSAKKYQETEWREKKLASSRAAYRKKPEQRAAYNREFKRKNPERARQLRYKRLLNGATPPRERPVHCELCGSAADKKKMLHLDHCHTTGMFRGWLCRGCNTAIGMMKDNPLLLERAADYVRFGGPT